MTFSMFEDYLIVNKYKSDYEGFHYDIDENELIIRNFDKRPIKLKEIPLEVLCALTKFIIDNLLLSICLFTINIFITGFLLLFFQVSILVFSCGIIISSIIMSPLFLKNIYFKSYVCGFFKHSNLLVFNVAKNFNFHNIRIYDYYYQYNLSDITAIIYEKNQYTVPEYYGEGNSLTSPEHIRFTNNIKLLMEEKKIIINLSFSTSLNPYNIYLGKEISEFLDVEYIVIGHHYYNKTTKFNNLTYYY